jgi:hypothetical protein
LRRLAIHQNRAAKSGARDLGQKLGVASVRLVVLQLHHRVSLAGVDTSTAIPNLPGSRASHPNFVLVSSTIRSGQRQCAVTRNSQIDHNFTRLGRRFWYKNQYIAAALGLGHGVPAG